MADAEQIETWTRAEVELAQNLGHARTQLTQALFALSEAAASARALQAGMTHHQVSVPSSDQVALLLAELDGITSEISRVALSLRLAGRIPTGGENGAHKPGGA